MTRQHTTRQHETRQDKTRQGCSPYAGSLCLQGGGGGPDTKDPPMSNEPPSRGGIPPMLTVSGLQVRPIEDQCEILLKQAHKLILIEQLPPPVIRTAASSRRNAVDRYKRELFSPMRASSLNLKTELKKLVEGSLDFVDVELIGGTGLLLPTDTSESSEGVMKMTENVGNKSTLSVPSAPDRVTYRELQRWIDEVWTNEVIQMC